VLNSPQYDIFPDRIYLTRIDPEKRMHRYYAMYVQRDLFGGATLIREWGRIGSHGQVLTVPYPDEGRAVDALAAIAKWKRGRGYE
jgi:predicted DNA-binding WGR domain protein